MTYCIEIEPTPRYICQIEVCIKNAFFVKQRSSQNFDQGTNNATSSPHHDCFRIDSSARV